MTNAGKMLFSMFMLVIIITYIALKINDNNSVHNKNSYADSIQSASQLAALNILDNSDINTSYDGARRDSNDIAIDFNILGTFRETLMRLLETNKTTSLTGVSNMNVPMVGFITYDYILGATYGEAADTVLGLDNLDITNEDYQVNMDKYDRDKKTSTISGRFLLPSGYTYYMPNSMSGIPSQLSNKIWRFTLGNIVYIDDTTSGDALDGNGNYTSEIKCRAIVEKDSSGNEKQILVEIDDNNLYDANGIKSTRYDITNMLKKYKFNTFDRLRDYVVMQSINNYLNTYTGSDFNPISNNADTSLEIRLSTSSHVNDGFSYDTNTNVISGPGVFAIVDVYTGDVSGVKVYERVATFGGSELVSVN